MPCNRWAVFGDFPHGTNQLHQRHSFTASVYLDGLPVNTGPRSTTGQTTPATSSPVVTPRLSIILVSLESRGELERAVRVIAPSLRDLHAQLVIVRRNAEPALHLSLASFGPVQILSSAHDATRVEMLAIAMRAAEGEVIVVRDDTAVQDADWLAGYRRLAERATAPAADVEVPIHPTEESKSASERQGLGGS